jgi:Tectonin domain
MSGEFLGVLLRQPKEKIMKSSESLMRVTAMVVIVLALLGCQSTGPTKPVQGLATWGVGTDGCVYRWNGTNWAEPNPSARLKQVAVSKQGGAVWGIGEDGRVYKWNGESWMEPNPEARLNQISNMDGNQVWGIGANYRIFRSLNGGASWDEPFPALQLKQVAAGAGSTLGELRRTTAS